LLNAESFDMSKVIKQMEMTALRQTFDGVRDMVVLKIKGLTCHADHQLRSTLRKKNIRLKVIKNSLTRRVFGEMGLGVKDDSPYWVGPTVLAWGAGSLAELAREIDAELKGPKTAPLYKDKVERKGAIADGLPVTFEQALKMPTRQEAIARVVMLALAPASRVVGQILGPASRVASQINTIKDKEEDAPAPAATPA
jgi:large subunit ribosomal protein L10